MTRHLLTWRLLCLFLNVLRQKQAVSGVSSEEYDKISHGDVQGMTSPSGSPKPAGHASNQDADGELRNLQYYTSRRFGRGSMGNSVKRNPG